MSVSRGENVSSPSRHCIMISSVLHYQEEETDQDILVMVVHMTVLHLSCLFMVYKKISIISTGNNSKVDVFGQSVDQLVSQSVSQFSDRVESSYPVVYFG